MTAEERRAVNSWSGYKQWLWTYSTPHVLHGCEANLIIKDAAKVWPRSEFDRLRRAGTSFQNSRVILALKIVLTHGGTFADLDVAVSVMLMTRTWCF